MGKQRQPFILELSQSFAYSFEARASLVSVTCALPHSLCVRAGAVLEAPSM